MSKVVKKPFIALRPVPVVLVSCGPGKRDAGGHNEPANIITIAWTGILCSNPPQVGIGVRPDRHSHGLIQETGEFVINIPGERLLDEMEYCGFVSGREVDKFEAQGLTPAPGSAVQTPIIAECPINIECRVSHSLSLGSHDLFIGEIVAVQLSEEVLDERGRVDNEKLKPILFTGNEYWGLGSLLGRYGSRQR
jgi:flavin reductase (DIM6/NTAB) family NADH-FMN oxidoreductase RutF